MATTTNYILSGEAGTQTYIDLGLQVGNLSFAGQKFKITGSDGDNSFFLRPAGYTFDFTDNRGGADAIYLTGERADYTASYGVDPDTGADIVILTRGSGDTSEEVIVSRDASDMTLSFADGALAADQIREDPLEEVPLNTENRSVDFIAPGESSGEVRVGSVGTENQANLFGLRGQSFTAIGNGGVDKVFVAAGGKVDATKLGVGEDEIYLEGSWASYSKTLIGNQITLTRQVVHPVTAEISNEEVKVIGGVGASNDRLFFADGSIRTRDMLREIRKELEKPDPDPDFDITGADVWDSGATSFSSGTPLGGADNLTLLSDTGALNDDLITSDGAIRVEGLTPGFTWQYSIDGGGTWLDGRGSSFTLDGQGEGDETGRIYDAGRVQVRQINPFGVVSDAVSNDEAIVIDVNGPDAPTITDAPALIEASNFVQLEPEGPEVLVLTGTMTGDVASLTVRWKDGEGGDGPSVEASLNDPEAGQWTAVFTKDQIGGMGDSDAVEFSLVAKDLAGNETVVVSEPLMLELGNAAPEVNQDHPVLPQVLLSGTQASSEPVTILDLQDLDGGGPTADDTAFIDADPSGTDNGTLTYSATWNGGDLPEWLTITENGVIQIVANATVPALDEPVTLVVRATDGAEAFAETDIIIDALAAPDLDAASDSGASDTDDLTNVTTPTFAGRLPAGTEAGTPVSIWIGTEEIAFPAATTTEPVNGVIVDYDTGAWSYARGSDLAEGPHEVAIEVNGLRSPSLEIQIDTTPTDEPAIELQLNALTLDNEDGGGAKGAELTQTLAADITVAGWVYIGNTDGATATGTESQTIFGAGGDLTVRIEPGGAIVLDADGQKTETGFAAVAGWHYIAVTREAGTPSFYFNGAKSSADFPAAAEALTGLRFGLGSQAGAAPLIDGAYRDIQVWNRALDKPGLEAAQGGAPVDTSDTDLVGYWPLAEGGPLGFKNAKPDGPALTPLGGASVEVFEDGAGFEGVVTAGGNPVIKGADSEPGARIVVTADDGTNRIEAETIVDADGTWRVTLFLEAESEAGYAITAVEVDAAGNESAVSNTIVIRAPTTPSLDPASDTGIAGDNITLDSTPTVYGVVPAGFEPGQSFSIYIDDEPVATATDETPVDGLELHFDGQNWTYSYTPPSSLDIGVRTFATRHDGAFSGSLVVEIVRPAPPVLDADSDTGVSNTDNLTNDPRPVLWGSLPEGTTADSVVEILMNGNPLPANLAAGLEIDYDDGSWRYEPLADLDHDVYEFALRVDGASSEPLTVNVDRIAEALPSAYLDSGSIRGIYTNNEDRNDRYSIFIDDIGRRGDGRETIMFWVFIDDPDADHTQTISTIGSSRLRLTIEDGIFEVDGTARGFEATRGWHHVAITNTFSFSQYQMSMYLNGEWIGGDFDRRRGDPIDRLRLGSSGGFQEGLQGGVFRDVQHWDRVLTDAERRAAMFSDPAAITDQDFQYHWPLTHSLEEVRGDNADAELMDAFEPVAPGTGPSFGLIPESRGFTAGADFTAPSDPVFSGIGANPGATVIVTATGGPEPVEVEVTADESGAWRVQLPLSPETGTDYLVTAVQTDAAGNMSEASPPARVRVEPGLPATPQLAPESDTGVLNDGVTADAAPTIIGTLPAGTQAGAWVTLTVNGATFRSGSGITPTDGMVVDYDNFSWRYTPTDPLPLGLNRVTMSVNNVESQTFEFTIAKLIPVITEQPSLVQERDFSGGDLTLRGEADAEAASVTVSWEGGPSVDVEVEAGTGAWTAGFSLNDMEALPDGASARFTVTAKDARGNVLGVVESDDVIIELENTAHESNDARPVIIAFAPLGPVSAAGGVAFLDLTDLDRDGDESREDTAFIDNDAVGSDNATFTYTLKAAAGGVLPDWLEITPGGVLQVVEGRTPPALEEPITVTVTATDGDGAAVDRDIQVGVQKAPVLKDGSDSGDSDTDNITNVATPVLTGELPPDLSPTTVIKIFRGTEVVASGSVGGPSDGLIFEDGSWTYASESLEDGDYVFTVSIGGSAATPLNVTVDTFAAAPGNVRVDGVDDGGLMFGDPVITGVADPGARVTVRVNDGATVFMTRIVEADAEGNWSATFDLAPGIEGEYRVAARQEDIAGNVSELSTLITFRVPSAQAPVLLDPDTGEPDLDNLTNDATPTLTGPLPEGIGADTEIIIYMNGDPVASGTGGGASGGLQITLDPAGWTYTPPNDLESRDHQFVVSVGGIESPPLTVTVKADPPAAPTVQTPFNALVLSNEDGAGAAGAEILYNFAAEATIAGWVYIGDSDGVTLNGSQAQVIFGTGGDLEVSISTGGAIMLGAGAAAVDTGFAASQGWHFIAVTRDASGQSFFFNDKKSASDFPAAGDALTRLRLGLGDAAGDRPLIGGGFSRVQLWDRALSEADLLAAYEGATPNTTDADLAGYWPLSAPGPDALDNAVAGEPTLTALDAAAVEVFPVGNNPLIRGAGAEPGAVVTITLNDGANDPIEMTVVADDDGGWRVTLPVAPAGDTDYTISVVQTDAVGNVSAPAVGVIHVSPAVFDATPVLDAASDTGLAGDNVTLDATPTVGGRLPPGYASGGPDFVLYINGEEVARANDNTPTNGLSLDFNNGTWSYTRPDATPFEPDAYEFRTSVNQETSPTLVVAIMRPEAPKLDAASDNGASDADDVTNDATPTLYGRLPAGTTAASEVSILLNGVPWATVPADGFVLDYETGSWRYTPTDELLDDRHEFQLRVDGAASEPLAVTIDTEAAPVAHDFPMRALVLNNDDHRGSGALEATLDVESGATTLMGWVYIAEPQAGRSQYIVYPLENVLYGININSNNTLRAGGENFSGDIVKAGWNFFAVSFASNWYTHYWNGELLKRGWTTAGELADETLLFGISDSGPLLGGAYRDLSVWNRELTQGEVEQVMNEGLSDLNDPDLADYWPLSETAGNAVGGDSDLQLQGEADFQDFDDAEGFQGLFSVAFEDDVPVIRGSGAEPGATVTVLLEDGPFRLIETAVSDEAGNWSVRPPGIENNIYRITVTQEDIAGNVSEPITHVISTGVKPGKPDLVDADDTGSVNDDDITNNFRPRFEGSLPDGVEEGALVEILLNGVPQTSGLTVNFETGEWMFRPPSNLPEGENEIVLAVNFVRSEPLTITTVGEVAGGVILDAPFPGALIPELNENQRSGIGSVREERDGPMTAAGWVYIADPESVQVEREQYIFDNGGAIELFIDPDTGTLHVGGWPNPTIDTGIQATEGWNYIAVSASEEGVIVYYNDQQSALLPLVDIGRTTVMRFGNTSNNSIYPFLGAFRELQVWNRVLDEQEVAAARGGAVDLNDEDLLGYWPVTETGGAVLENQVAGGPDLEIEGDASFGVWPPATLLDEAYFDENDLNLEGRYFSSIVSLKVFVFDSEGNERPIEAEISDDGTWTATVQQADVQGFADGGLSLRFEAAGIAGNMEEYRIEDISVLENVNEAPQSNTNIEIQDFEMTLGDVGAPDGGTVLADLAELGAFIDNDAPGSKNTMLVYSIERADGKPLPDWLEITPEGLLRVIEGKTVTHIGEMTVRVTATDRNGDAAGLSASRDIVMTSAMELTSAIDGVNRIDVRSDIVIEAAAAGQTLALTRVPGVYEIRLIETATTSSSPGYADDNGDSSQTVTVRVEASGFVSVEGGEIRFVNGKAVIDFDHDLDLANNFELQVDPGLFADAQTGAVALGIGPEEVEFSTVRPGRFGSAATIWNGEEYVAGPHWIEATTGSHIQNDNGASWDLSIYEAVILIGRDLNPDDTIRLHAGGRTMLTNFGANDHIYIDRAFGSSPNDVSVNNVGVDDGGNTDWTILTFSGEEGSVGVLIKFADRDNTIDDESEMTATALLRADAAPDEHSFESITGNGSPVISG